MPLKVKATFENLEFATPTGCTMLGGQHVEIAVGEGVLIVGARETGKTLLFRAIAGLWPWGLTFPNYQGVTIAALP